MSRFIRPLCCVVVAGLALVALGQAAHAVVINTSRTTVNLSAPAHEAGWNNVATMSGASAVYLGNGWMISANHVADGPVTFPDGRTFNIAPGSDRFLLNPPNSGLGLSPDLRLFQLTTDPGLPTLGISTATPASDTTVTMIGAGTGRTANLIGWSLSDALSADTVWRPIALPFAGVTGFQESSTKQLAWGVGRVDVSGDSAINGNTIVFSTTFNSHSGGFIAQATSGDSGGGVFQEHAGHSTLVGIMDAVKPLTNQPIGTIVFGDQTFSVDLSQYHDQIVAIMSQPLSSAQSLAVPNAASAATAMTASRVLDVVDALQSHGSFPVSPSSVADAQLDINHDGQVSPLDALDAVAMMRDGSFPLTQGTQVPEPSTAVLALVGLLLLLAGRYRWGLAAVARRG